MKIWFCLTALILSACSAAGPERVAAQLAAQASRAPGEWIEIAPAAAHIDGRVIEATCSNAPGTDPAYRFWVKRGASNNLVIYFDGGGACWDDVTCSVPRRASSRDPRDGFYKAELLPGDNPGRLGGIFDLDNPRNPVRDWSFVFVPYCTGDVHSGSNSARYTDVDTGEPFTIEHRGADNFRVVLDWARGRFDRPGRILVAGSSAGAYGAATHFARVRAAFPSGRAIMLGDAGQGVSTTDFLAKRNGSWGYQLPESVFGPDAALTPDDDVVGRLAKQFPNDRFAQYTTAQDRIQVAFYALMGAYNPCVAWSAAMTRDLTRRQGAANFRAYVAAGDTHTILGSRLFYSEDSGGEPFSEWLAQAINGDDKAWRNRGCEGCAAPPPPPPERCIFGGA